MTERCTNSFLKIVLNFHLFNLFFCHKKTSQKECLLSFGGIKSECDPSHANDGFAWGKQSVCVVL